jgi:hypothetical protein
MNFKIEIPQTPNIKPIFDVPVDVRPGARTHGTAHEQLT